MKNEILNINLFVIRNLEIKICRVTIFTSKESQVNKFPSININFFMSFHLIEYLMIINKFIVYIFLKLYGKHKFIYQYL